MSSEYPDATHGKKYLNPFEVHMHKVDRLKRFTVRTLSQIRSALRIKPRIPHIDVIHPSAFPNTPQDNTPIKSDVRVIAYYLPQFHPFPENDAWWGKGFTEWTNVGKAAPNFKGHSQPHCPIHLGYYDLRLVENMIEQARLAKAYGIHGFCYYFYWFDSKVLMRQPLEKMLEDPRVDLPFCLIWANENWSRRWDGKEDDILIAQKHSTDDSLAFIQHLEKYFRDERYIKVNGKPVLAIYRANLIPDVVATGALWRAEAQRMGFPGLYLVAAQSFDITSPETFGFDAAVQFPPHPIDYPLHNHEVDITNPSYKGQIYDYGEAARRFVTLPEPPYKLMRTCMLSWDNTARKQHSSITFKDFSLFCYQQWLSHNLNATAHDTRLSTEERLTFVNAWNEWAEGTHLEPDQRYGYGYLQATYDALKHYNSAVMKVTSGTARPVRQHAVAVVLHIHYSEVFEQLAALLEHAFPLGDFDLYTTVTSGELAVGLRQRFPKAYVRIVENRGRDILPFVLIHRLIHNLGYEAVCKVHSKRSVYRADGDQLLNGLVQPILGSREVVQSNLRRMQEDSSVGMLVPRSFLLRVTPRNTVSNLRHIDWLENLTDIEYGYSDFAAGTMFWYRPEALKPLLALKAEHFELEDGRADGSLPHAVERMMTSWSRSSGYAVVAI